MSGKVYGVVRVMNTLSNGSSVQGLEAGSAVFSKEATEFANEFYPDSIVAVTNMHVVGEQSQVMLNFHFSQIPFPASVLKVCPQYDLAFLHIDTNSEYFTAANLDPNTQKPRKIELIEGCSIVDDNLEEFTDVTSVGFPSGTAHQTITRGNLTARDIISGNLVLLHNCLINPGNSGGALLHKGKFVGVNTAITTQPQSVSIATPFELVNSLIPYLKPTLSHDGMSPEAFRQLLAHYHVSTPPDVLLSKFKHFACGGLKDGQIVSFAEWFNEHCLHDPSSHELIQKVLSHLENDPMEIHKLKEQGWMKCADHSVNCKSIETAVVPERIVFNDHFQVSTTIPMLDKVVEKYGSSGVVITNSLEHETVEDGQILLAINGRNLDNYGNFIDSGAPHFTGFKFCPGTPVTLKVGTGGEVKEVDYTYNLVDKIPRIHAPQLTPYTPVSVIHIGGLAITQMNAQMAAQSYPQYLKAPLNDKVVGVVVAVDPMCAEWHIQNISPGYLLTKVNGQEMQGSIEESLGGANFVTFEGKGKSFIKLLAL